MSLIKMKTLKSEKSKVTSLKAVLQKKENQEQVMQNKSTVEALDANLSSDLFHPMAAIHRQAYFTNLQQTYGNQYVQRLMTDHTGNTPSIQRQVEEEEEEPIQSKLNNTIQRQVEEEEEESIQSKFSISKPGDKYEQEADRVAEAVINKPNQQVQHQTYKTNHKYFPMTKTYSKRKSATNDDFRTQLSLSKSSGKPLPLSVREGMEQHFTVDFKRVRIHTDNQSKELANEINAEAFTHGSDIYFSQGKYRPGTSNGDRLLAHELTHVVQNGKNTTSMIQRQLKVGKAIEKLIIPALQSGNIQYPDIHYDDLYGPKEGEIDIKKLKDGAEFDFGIKVSEYGAVYQVVYRIKWKYDGQRVGKIHGEKVEHKEPLISKYDIEISDSFIEKEKSGNVYKLRLNVTYNIFGKFLGKKIGSPIIIRKRVELKSDGSKPKILFKEVQRPIWYKLTGGAKEARGGRPIIK